MSRDNLFHYDSLKCSECGSNHELYQNRFNDRVLCVQCINNKLREVEAKKPDLFIMENEDE